MKAIDIFYQGECIDETDHVEADATETIGEVKRRLIDKHGAAEDVLVYCEDEDDPIGEDHAIESVAGAAGAKLHLHRCRRIAVAVNFSGQTVSRKFGPGTTVAKVKKWAARREFGMTKEEAGEHVLQMTGSHERPAPGTHLGRLTSHQDCAVQFDLVPDERINGGFLCGGHEVTPV